MTHKEKALQLFADKFHCSQAVLAAYASECGITQEQALRLGSCFGSGMRKGEVCGACSGALMVLGLLYGYDTAGDVKSSQKTNEMTEEMMDRFAKINGSYLCNDLLGCDIRTISGVQYARANNLFTEFCPQMISNAIDILEDMINTENAKNN